MAKKLGLALLICVWHCGAAAQQYTALTNHIQYRICRHGKAGGGEVKAGGFVHLRLWMAGQAAYAGERYWIKIDDEPRRSSLHNALMQLSLGDSAEIALPYAMVLEGMVNLQRIKGLRPADRVSLRVRVLRIVDADIAFDKDYEQFCRQQEQQSQRWIAQYLADNPVFEKRKSGIYARTLRTGSRQSSKGNVMLLAYTGRFLSGAKFDNTPKSGLFRYVRGVPFQMIQGIVMTLAEMSEGSKMQVIIPPALAFGSRGLADIVPPFVPVIYDIEVIKIERQ